MEPWIWHLIVVGIIILIGTLAGVIWLDCENKKISKMAEKIYDWAHEIVRYM